MRTYLQTVQLADELIVGPAGADTQGLEGNQDLSEA